MSTGATKIGRILWTAVAFLIALLAVHFIAPFFFQAQPFWGVISLGFLSVSLPVWVWTHPGWRK